MQGHGSSLQWQLLGTGGSSGERAMPPWNVLLYPTGRGRGDRSPAAPSTCRRCQSRSESTGGGAPFSTQILSPPCAQQICVILRERLGSPAMMSLPLLLALACTLETDLGVRPEAVEQRECALMWSTHAETAYAVNGRLDLVVQRYVSGFRCAGKKCDTQRYRVIRAMNVRGDAPLGWDVSAGPWSKYRGLWLRRLRAAREFAAAFMYGLVLWPQTNSRCRMARHYGGRCAAHGACDHVPSCWELARCGDTTQAYWIPHTCPRGSSDTIDARLASARR